MFKLSTVWSFLLIKFAYIEKFKEGWLLGVVKQKLNMMIKRRSKKKKMSFYQQKQARSAECLLTIAEETPLQHGNYSVYNSLDNLSIVFFQKKLNKAGSEI